jgi:hypothetical protein
MKKVIIVSQQKSSEFHLFEQNLGAEGIQLQVLVSEQGLFFDEDLKNSDAVIFYGSGHKNSLVEILDESERPWIHWVSDRVRPPNLGRFVYSQNALLPAIMLALG